MKRNKYNNILLTGASGKLGQAIISSNIFPRLLCPNRKLLDIAKPINIKKYFEQHKVDAVIHCAALARMSECELHPIKAIETNVIGTANLVKAVIRKERESKASIRFIYISTDGAYPGQRGNYSEKDETIPYNKYGWSKLGGECCVNLLSNFCIIRTSFFDPAKIAFACSAIDSYSSRVTVGYLVKAILFILNTDFIGVVNIGEKRKSDYKRYKEFKSSLKPCKRIDIVRKVDFKIAKDASLNCNLWEKIAKAEF